MNHPLNIIKAEQETTIEPVPGHKLADLSLATRAANLLATHYPGYVWRVWLHDEPEGMVMYVVNMDICASLFSNNLFAYVLHLATVYADPSLRCVVRAGGEILERANLIRGRSTGVEPKKIDGVPDHMQPIYGVTIFS